MKFSSDILKIRDSKIYNKNTKKDIKIASVSDIHISNIVGIYDINNICDVLFEEHPNYICILGDIIDSPNVLNNYKKVNELLNLIYNCASIAPTLMILGSHDFIKVKNGKTKDTLNSNRIWKNIDNMYNTFLLNDKIFISNEIIISGYRQKKDTYYSKTKFENSEKYYKNFCKQKNIIPDFSINLPKVLLTHSPEPIQNDKVIELLQNFDIIITGHFHNGCIPGIIDDIYSNKNGGIITPKKRFFPKEARGIIKLKTGTFLIYNGGWVKLQDCAPKILQPLDKLCYRQIDITTITSNLDKDIEITSRKKVLKLNKK